MKSKWKALLQALRLTPDNPYSSIQNRSDWFLGVFLPLACTAMEWAYPDDLKMSLNDGVRFLVALEWLGLVVWLVRKRDPGRWMGWFSALLLAGMVLNLGIAVFLLPYAAAGLGTFMLYFIGVLGVAPWFTALVFARNFRFAQVLALRAGSKLRAPYVACFLLLAVLGWIFNETIAIPARNECHPLEAASGPVTLGLDNPENGDAVYSVKLRGKLEGEADLKLIMGTDHGEVHQTTRLNPGIVYKDLKGNFFKTPLRMVFIPHPGCRGWVRAYTRSWSYTDNGLYSWYYDHPELAHSLGSDFTSWFR